MREKPVTNLLLLPSQIEAFNEIVVNMRTRFYQLCRFVHFRLSTQITVLHFDINIICTNYQSGTKKNWITIFYHPVDQIFLFPRTATESYIIQTILRDFNR